MELSRAVERVAAMCRAFGLASLWPQVEACTELLRGGGVVDVAVLGQFKAGKSSFLNGLIGSAVLPVHVLPATAVVTRVGYGPGERVTVHGLAGEPFEIPLSQLAGFVTERGNPANEKRVSLVDVELPTLFAFEGIRFVDTPGLGSVFAHNTRASKDWMPRVGAALVAVSVNHPLSEDDLLLLNDVSLHTPEVAILLTKADLVSGEELASVIEFTRSQATSRTGKEWRIRFAGARFEAQVEEPSRPDVRLSPTFDTHFELLWFLIPMPVFRPLVHRHFLRRIPWEAEKNLSRVAAQWADAVGRVIVAWHGTPRSSSTGSCPRSRGWSALPVPPGRRERRSVSPWRSFLPSNLGYPDTLKNDTCS